MKALKNKIVWNGLQGPSLNKLEEVGDPGILRPYRIGDKCYVTLTNKDTGKPEHHQVPFNTATLPHEVWLQIDQTVTRAMRKRLKAVADLVGQNLTYNIPNGFGITGLMTQTASRIGTAKVGMDPTEKGPSDLPVVSQRLIPLPCIWSDIQIGARVLATSRRGGLPLDMATSEDSAFACAETAEQMLIGNGVPDKYKYIEGAVIYGYTDFPSRVTFSITAPDSSGWVGSTLLSELLAARQGLINKKKYGPYAIYLSPAWSKYLDGDYNSTTSGQTTTITIRERILKVGGFSEIRELDYLTGWDILIVQMETDTVREIIGMPWTTVQWEEQGGQVLNYKIMGIYVPDIRADYDGNCGVAHGSVA